MKEAVDNRISRRSYTGRPIEKGLAQKLREEVEKVNQESGLTIAFVENGREAFTSLRSSYGMFSGVRSLFLMKGSKRDPDLKEKIGYYGEKLILLSTQLGLGTCWVGGTFDSSAKAIVPGKDEEVVAVIPVGYVADNQTLKEKALRSATKRKAKLAEERYRADGPLPEWFLKGIEGVTKAPSALNSQKAFFVYEQGQARGEIPGDYRFDMVDLGIAKLHFEIAAGGKFAFGNGGAFTKE